MQKLSEENYLMKFLKETANLFKWPTKDDIAEVKSEYIFYVGLPDFQK